MPGSVQAPAISINKTWILPPKPKPGRKPAVDTPPTKRKAQNREAQRAFRERRAAKVGELEEEMKKLEEEDTREQAALRERISQLEYNLEECSSVVDTWRERFNEMQLAYVRERQSREQAETELENLRKVMRGGTDAVALPSRQANKKEYSSEESNGVAHGNSNIVTEEVPMTCGKCSDDTRCQCIEEAFEMGNLGDDTAAMVFKRPHSPQMSTDNKRLRQDDDDQEIDFTTRRPSTLTTSASTSSSVAAVAPPDPCGFCQDGSPCICAELSRNPQQQLSLPSFSRQSTTNGSTASDPCANGPGTCAQCRSNPTSTLFCTSVAANRSSTTKSNFQPNEAEPAAPQSTGPTLSCADAFTTLSRHPGFSAATNELNSWVPKLTPISRASSVPERTAFDIEAASVMSVLKLFDRRFGSQEDGEVKSFDLPNGTSNGVDDNGGNFIAYEAKSPARN